MINQTTTRIGLALVAAAMLSGCERSATSASADTRICTPFASTSGASGPTTPVPGAPMAGSNAAVVDDCLHRWSYRLAGASDSADQVGKAVVQACSENLTAWNTEAMNNRDPRGPEYVDSATGRPMSPADRNSQYAQGKALFYVVQARAGHCVVPS